MPGIALLCPTWDSVRTQLTAWAEPTLAILGILTLLGAIYSWWEHRQVVNLRVARRGRRVHRVIHEWLHDGSYDLANSGRLKIWQERVTRGEDEVQDLLEQMVDLAGDTSPRVQRATRDARGVQRLPPRSRSDQQVWTAGTHRA